MRSYKEIADIVREQGDAILERRRIRAQRIKRISCAVSGLCAAVIIGAAVWHNSALNKAPNPDFGKIPVVTPTETTAVTTKEASVTTASTTVNEVKTTSAKAKTATTSAAHTTSINVSQTISQTPVSYVNTTAVSATVRVNEISTENVQTTTLTVNEGNTSAGDPHGAEESMVITPVTTEPGNEKLTVTTVNEITIQTTTISVTSPDGPVTTSNTNTAEIIVTTVPTILEEDATDTEILDEETIKARFSEINFNRRTYSYDRSVDYKPDLTIYMPFDDYLLQAGDGSSCTAKTQLYMPETEEKNHLWVKFEKKAEYCLYILNN
ncbi:MAG: hypothetical protein J6U00_02690 [Ruminococcus sp.]|uniref:hypothetical protein n=1 Tax=Ruminococcus sp. TaxID=41978 RepID=UPI001B282CE2|nr:hypothetical protein [Ruminococcus sp.]MBO7472905.1 hypothetical protein [Ruminococcus sp.]